MGSKRTLKPIPRTKVKIFRIANRRGFAAICYMNLTEGSSPFKAYCRMQKAVKRMGFCLPDIMVDAAKSLVRKTI
ncbi:MAG: hypothetical protein A2487_14555 [Candidatus Raymondbacteria bacterium RifOxyC12_full_50_8]|uniref:Uncharacterized protein n=1 Tax=Candidatus Raymondbacteria bacterium RIFOXYD12_FULL_49_13 TaxID=1817890 RepID=A0A1F7F6K7_UNCRA|nr:MAG: hypothetical protein A2248_03510 [Candidatus Raymondbacteria bacterium RIFOXYA2_FULL_49_16]OGJ99645.1 MAG: hypothetical protein A2350_16165 [Candidatus Raymondbacteria bacterium RifOxyB12_full_50_8]OGK02136.1 MAG: hypothetical protein A2519_18925 [Candidatus Raymondbacteria bacterium RIFOXYD12_FULL_49_13]OGK06863.1 MAG: hypothetical protein A2487_14555 [Candidatus Raymondbacteria bacterium RifOxyC12_full_50_8]OGP42521.1 MAG: hypothetical protein A2324_17545 [Candidatus Raymondbacteria b